MTPTLTNTLQPIKMPHAVCLNHIIQSESQICGGLPTPKHASIEVIGPPENMKVVYTCNENRYDLYGRSERFCDAEKENWIYLEPYCYRKLTTDQSIYLSSNNYIPPE